jgi:hypothetical protein
MATPRIMTRTKNDQENYREEDYMRNLDNNVALFSTQGYKVWYQTNMAGRHIGQNVEGEVEGLNGYQVTIIIKEFKSQCIFFLCVRFS